MKDHAGATLRISPANGPLLVTDHVACPAFKTLLVAENDAAVRGRHEEISWTGGDTGFCAAAAARSGIHFDMGLGGEAEFDGRHPILETFSDKCCFRHANAFHAQ